jgi:alpha-amylase/alpha-mannosidase (GH57 family)
MERYICIHGHFYQPPRENPWLETIELQDSAYPYHDWNERITAECYAPNALSRILGEDGHIARLVNNYAKISFNFGPTLLSWLAEKAPDVYQSILQADKESQERFGGHGSAIAQAYNHIIMPLANQADKFTQAVWGVRDFETRFGRRPEGMWLPEAAVDLESLDIMADLGIRFTILSPHQALRVRKIGSRQWRDASGGAIDPTTAYEQRLPSGRKIAVFFYDGSISRSVAFEDLLRRGEEFAHRLTSGFRDDRPWPQIVNIATDGESYGHHHRFGDMALAFALQHIESNHLAHLINYGAYLERHPPEYEVEIREQSSWSCAHGVERWRADCGCNSGGHPGWSQAWRRPLREALDWLRDALVTPYNERASTLLRDPRQARDHYIGVILDRSPERVEGFFREQATRELNETEKIMALKLLEMQRHAMLMYTSCGWFFDELSGIETVQVIHYAGRAAQLATELFGDSIESDFVDRLALAKSNVAQHGDGRRIYDKLVRPAKVDWEKVGAHYAIASSFESYPDETRIYCYNAQQEDYQTMDAGKTKLITGRVRLTSLITLESMVLSFGVVYFGDHNVNGWVRKFLGEEVYRSLVEEVKKPFAAGDLPEVIRLMDRHFGESNYSIRTLFRDEQRKIMNLVLASTLAEAEAAYTQLYEKFAPMMRFLTTLHMPLPLALQAPAEVVLNARLRAAMESKEIDAGQIRAFLEETKVEGAHLDGATLEYALRKNLEEIIARFVVDAENMALLQRLEGVAQLFEELPFEIDLWAIQNDYYRMVREVYPGMRAKANHGDATASDWIARFTSLGRRLGVSVF